LVEALKRLHKKVKNFDAILIETTGMADPAPVAQTFFVDDEIKEKFRLDGIVTVVDAKHLVQHLDEEKPEGVENESVEQIAFADRIILNKCDLVEDTGKSSDVQLGICSTTASNKTPDEKLKEIEDRIKEINSQAPIIRAKFSQVDPKQLLNIQGFDLNRVLEMDPEFLKPESADHQHDESVSSVAWALPGLELNVNKLQRWISTLLQDLGTEMFRYKGVLAVKGKEEKYVFQGVHMLFMGGFRPELKWEPGEKRECRFVFIGKNMKQVHGERLLKEFKGCEAESNLRFAIGDTIEARCDGGWKKAKVLNHWENGNPYLLELLDAKQTQIWGPMDDDMFVRKAR